MHYPENLMEKRFHISVATPIKYLEITVKNIAWNWYEENNTIWLLQKNSNTFELGKRMNLYLQTSILWCVWIVHSLYNKTSGYQTLMQRAESFEKTLMLEKIQSRRRRRWQRLDSEVNVQSIMYVFHIDKNWINFGALTEPIEREEPVSISNYSTK